jgi:hypothetical protein
MNISTPLFTAVILLTVSVIVVLFWTAGSTTNGLSVQSAQVSLRTRSPRPMPVVENFYAQGWDFRARNNEEQIFVLTHPTESFETKLFRIGAALNLSAHLGYAPPTVVVSTGRFTDSDIPETYRDIPELIQDIFPRIRVISVQDMNRFVKSLPDATLLKGDMKMHCGTSHYLQEFPSVHSTTIIFDGDWESWMFLDDYRKGMFEHLEFHPIIYHHCRKTYPQLFDRKTPTKGIFINSLESICVEEIKVFIHRNKVPGEKILMFIPQPLGNKILTTIFGEDYENHVSIVVGECAHVQMYLGVFCRELLIDVSRLSWWVGFHAVFRGKPVYYYHGCPLFFTHQTLHPGWSKNKNDI